jgi:hypothetical protein
MVPVMAANIADPTKQARHLVVLANEKSSAKETMFGFWVLLLLLGSGGEVGSSAAVVVVLVPFGACWWWWWLMMQRWFRMGKDVGFHCNLRAKYHPSRPLVSDGSTDFHKKRQVFQTIP